MSKVLSKITDFLREYIAADKKIKSNAVLNKYFNSVIIAAAGMSTRFSADTDVTKQMTLIDGMPVVAKTVSVFEKCDFIDEIIIVAKADEIPYYDDFSKKYGFSRIKAVVVGGDTRQISVSNGLKYVSDKADYIAIHDAARCLVTEENIKNVFLDAYRYGAATAAQKAKDTAKYATADGFIESTVDRNFLWNAQTPQIFKYSLYLTADAIAKRDGIEVTDDCMLAENAGFKIKLTDCGYENLKITTPEDFVIAKSILENRKHR